MRLGMAAKTFLREIDNDLDVVRLRLERLGPLLDRYAPRHQPVEPGFVGALQNLCCRFIVGAISVDRAEYGVVVEHHGAIEIADVNIQIMPRRGHTDETNDTARAGKTKRVANDGGRSGAFHQNVGLERTEVSEAAEMKHAAKIADDLPFLCAIAV